MSSTAEKRDWLTAHEPARVAVWKRVLQDAESASSLNYLSGRSPLSLVSAVSVTVKNIDVSKTFQEMSAKWKQDTLFMSSVQDKVLHYAYQRIIGLGRDALPFIFDDLSASRSDWFWALEAITGENPVPPRSRGIQREMIECWIRWGRANGYF